MITVFFRFAFVIYTRGLRSARELSSDFERITKEYKFSPGCAEFLRNRSRFADKSQYDEVTSMTQSASMDIILEQVGSYFVS